VQIFGGRVVAKPARMFYNHAADISVRINHDGQSAANLSVKIIFAIIAGLFVSCAAVRADVEIVQLASGTNAVFPSTLRISGRMARLDRQENTNGSYAVIIDLDTRDSFTLLPKEKKFIQLSGEKVKSDIALDFKLFGATNDFYFPPQPALATGIIEPVAGYDTEIYSWRGAHGIEQKLWVAKKFPDYDKIRAELAKLDKFNLTGRHPNTQPELAKLPGMVVKSETTLGQVTQRQRLLSASVKPLDTNLFVLPPDYTPWVAPKPKVSP
jgi:hypothetical protein